jgi:hypothetical protein
MKDVKSLMKRAVKNGFDLSFVENYNEKAIIQGLYDFLIREKYFCSLQDGVIYVGPDIIEDVAEVRIENKVMKVTPLTEKGFFDTLVTLFKYIKHLSTLMDEMPQEDISTETDEDDESSEEMWL